MIVAVAAGLVREPVQDEHAILERFERGEDFLQLEIATGFIRPVVRRDGSVRAEHDHQPLAQPRGSRKAEARQARRNGSDAAESPTLLMNWRRWRVFMVIVCRLSALQIMTPHIVEEFELIFALEARRQSGVLKTRPVRQGSSRGWPMCCRRRGRNFPGDGDSDVHVCYRCGCGVGGQTFDETVASHEDSKGELLESSGFSLATADRRKS